MDALKIYIFGAVDARKNFSHLVASTFVNDSSELRSALPWSDRQQAASSIEFLQPTDYRTRLARMWVVVIRWLLKHTKQIGYSGEVESEFNIQIDPQKLYYSKPRSAKLPRLDSYAKWAIELGFDKDELRGFSAKRDIHARIDDWVSDICAETNQLWRDLVPAQGVAPMPAGEIIRAHGRIENDFYRNGLLNLDIAYQELLTLINVTLTSKSSFSDRVKAGIQIDCAVVDRAGNLAISNAISGLEVGTSFGALGNSFFAKTDTKSALKRLEAP
jgi:hypothetical protein